MATSGTRTFTLAVDEIIEEAFSRIGGEPQTGKEIDEWDCAVKWMPMLLIENSQQQRQTGAAVESFRNVVAANPISILMGSKDAKPILDITNDDS